MILVRPLVLALIVLMSAPSLGAVYYVDSKHGSDARSGLSIMRAWQTISKANTTLAPGDTCLIQGGRYPSSRVDPSRSGTARARITYAAYGRETPEIIGRPTEAAVDLTDKAYVTIRGLKLTSVAKVLVARWRRHYNQVRPHSALGYRPPAPEAVQPWYQGWVGYDRQITAAQAVGLT
jgi:hypothetical protein